MNAKSGFRTKQKQVAFALAALMSLQSFSASAGISKDWHITTVMKKAANDFDSVRAGKKRIDSAEEQRRAILLNSLSVSGSAGISTTNTQIGTLPETQTHTKTGTVGAALTLSMATWFNMKASDITIDLQKAALKALRMQLATEAADYHMRYSTSSARVIYLNFVLKGLKDIQDQSEGKKLSLSDTSRALLSSALVDYGNELAAELHNIDTAGAYLEKYLGHKPPSITPLIEQLTANARSLSREKTVSENDFQGLPWDELDATFAVPKTAEIAFERSSKSPALIQAGLNEKQARNQWYLTLASAGPVFSIALTRNLTSSTGGDPSLAGFGDMGSTTGSASVSFQIGAGLISSLRSSTILEEAARLDTRAQKKTIKAVLVQTYNNMQLAREQLKSNEENFKQLMLAYNNLQITDDKSFTQFLDLLSAVSQTSQGMARLANSYQMTKIQIHGLMGTLLEAMDKEEARVSGKK